MPNLPISGLPPASSLDGSELFAAVQGGITKYTTLDEISTFGTGSFMVTGSISGPVITFTKGDGSTFNLNLTPGGGFPLNYGLFNQTGSSIPVTNTIVETSLLDGGIGTLTIPANGFSKGDAYRLSMTGHISSKNNDTLEIRIKAGSTLLADTGVLSMPQTTNKDFSLDINFSIFNTGSTGVASITSGGKFLYSKDASNAFEGANFSIINSSSFDTTINNTLSITAQWGAADPLNSIYSEIVTLNKIY